MENNNNLTNVIWPSSSTVITDFRIMSSAITTLDLSNLTGLGGDVRANSTTSLTSVVLPASSQVFTELYFQLCSLTSFDITDLSADNSFVDINVSGNDIETTELETLFSDLKNKGWTDGELNISSNPGDIYESNTDYIWLDANGWIISGVLP